MPADRPVDGASDGTSASPGDDASGGGQSNASGGRRSKAADAEAEAATEEDDERDEVARSEHWERVQALSSRAQRDQERFEPPETPPDEERAMRYLREGVGPAISVYVEGRTGGDLAAFSDVEVSLLEAAVSTWLGLYARCYGVDRDVDVSLRQAAELLIDTRNVADTAALLTRVPDDEVG